MCSLTILAAGGCADLLVVCLAIRPINLMEGQASSCQAPSVLYRRGRVQAWRLALIIWSCECMALHAVSNRWLSHYKHQEPGCECSASQITMSDDTEKGILRRKLPLEKSPVLCSLFLAWLGASRRACTFDKLPMVPCANAPKTLHPPRKEKKRTLYIYMYACVSIYVMGHIHSYHQPHSHYEWFY